MLTAARLSRSLAAFIALLVGIGVVLGWAATAAAVALFVILLAAMDAKPSWRWFYDAPGDTDSGRASARFFSWRRVGPRSPRERLPDKPL